MLGPDVVGLVAELADSDPAACDRVALGELASRSQQVRSWLDALDARIALAASRLAELGSSESPVALLCGNGRRSIRDAEAVERRGRVCDEMPSMHDALAGGYVSAGHVDAIARVVPQLDERGRSDLRDLQTTLVETARTTTVEHFEREVQRLGRILSRDDGVSRHERMRLQRCVKRWVDKVTGMCVTQLHLDPENDARVSAAFDAAFAGERTKDQRGDERTFDQLKADALVDLITRPTTGERRPPAADVSVLIDISTLGDGLHERAAVCETGDGHALPPETVRRLCCAGVIVPIVGDSAGAVLDAGRAVRVANRDQRRALRAMYRTCGHPGCTVRFADCDIHHVVEWSAGGATDLANLLPLCSRHHHAVHEGGWTLVLHADRRITLRRPDGSSHFHGSTVDVAPPESDEPLGVTFSELADLARARVRALGPPVRAPAA